MARTWFWGPRRRTRDASATQKPEAAHRLVQYFDKSRMEINDPTGDQNSKFYVTNGLLTVELMSGKIQTGDNTLQTAYPANINMTGDDGDTTAPSYAAFAARVQRRLGDHRAADRTGQDVIATMDRVGFVANDPAKASTPSAKIAYFETRPATTSRRSSGTS